MARLTNTQEPRPALLTCPTCGLETADVRCPRCFTLKVTTCTGACSSCKSAACATNEKSSAK